MSFQGYFNDLAIVTVCGSHDVIIETGCKPNGCLAIIIVRSHLHFLALVTPGWSISDFFTQFLKAIGLDFASGGNLIVQWFAIGKVIHQAQFQ